MREKTKQIILVAAFCFAPLPHGLQLSHADEELPVKISFNYHVRPILSENCFFCHGPDPNHREADLRLDTESGYLDCVVPGSPDDSELILRILADDEEIQMPPPHSGRTLNKHQIAILEKWIEQGAEFEQHWSFQNTVRPKIPATENKDWPRNPIDHFVLSTLERKNIRPSPRAGPAILVRRLYLDLIGLPPTPEQSDQFLERYKSNADEAIESLVDQLLVSNHYGERMAYPWLDAARYSDSNGFQNDGDRNQWPWRDWVVEALNENMPFDKFTIEQLAGDLLPNPDNKKLIATAFNRNHMLNGEGGSISEEQRNNYVFDRVDTTATTWLGLTMSCAQCHDHKYDPITQEDYYRFFAFFNTIDESGRVDFQAGRRMCAKPYLELPSDAQTQKLKNLNSEIKAVSDRLKATDDEIVDAMRNWENEARNKAAPKKMNRNIFNILVKLPSERNKGEENSLKSWYLENAAKKEWRELKQKENALNSKKTQLRSKILTVMIMREQKTPRKSFLLKRGDYLARGKEVTQGVPHFLPQPLDQSASRLDLANWLVSDKNPLTSRVQVNRYWQLFFGTGLVKTAEDFGVQGELPSHPSLLDWLAVEFQESGWNTKAIHKLIVTSETYLQSSRHRPELVESDPENRLLARGARFRLPSAIIRDSALAVSGLLNTKIGGKPVYPYQPARLWKEFSLEKFGYTPSTGKDLHRRSLYTFWRRTVPPPNMFDSSNRQTCSVKPSRTNTPIHALIQLNDPTFVESACFLAQDVLANSNDHSNKNSLVNDAFRRVTSRYPKPREQEFLTDAYSESYEYFGSHHQDANKYVAVGHSIKIPKDDNELVCLAALTSVVQIALNTDEFLNRE